MAIISCPECGRQVSDKALKCPQCSYPIVNIEKPESASLQALQEKIQDVVSANSLTVNVSSVGQSLNIKLTRSGVKIIKPAYDQLWIKILSHLKTDDLRGFNNLLIASNFEGDIKSEWERQNDIDSTGKLLPNQQDLILGAVGVVIVLLLGIGGAFYFFNPFRSVPSSSSSSTTSPEYLLAGIDKKSRDVSASELAPYTQVLDQLVPKCQESRMEIVNMSASAQDILTKKGAKANNLELLNGVYGMVRHYKTPQKCESGFNMFVIGVDK